MNDAEKDIVDRRSQMCALLNAMSANYVGNRQVVDHLDIKVFKTASTIMQEDADTITTLREEVERLTKENADILSGGAMLYRVADARAEKAEAAVDSLSGALKTAKSHLKTLGGDHRGEAGADALQCAVLDKIDEALASLTEGE